MLGSNGKATNINLDDDVKYLEVNTEDVKGIGNEANLEKASETGIANEYYANVSYYVEGGEALLVVIDTTGKWNNGTTDVTVTQCEATTPTKAQVATATTSAGSLTVTGSSIDITDGETITLTGYSGTANKFDVKLTAASNTSATMTLEGNILKNGPVIATGDKTDIEVTGEGNITGKIVITGDGLATKTINFTIKVQK